MQSTFDAAESTVAIIVSSPFWGACGHAHLAMAPFLFRPLMKRIFESVLGILLVLGFAVWLGLPQLLFLIYSLLGLLFGHVRVNTEDY